MNFPTPIINGPITRQDTGSTEESSSTGKNYIERDKELAQDVEQRAEEVGTPSDFDFRV